MYNAQILFHYVKIMEEGKPLGCLDFEGWWDKNVINKQTICHGCIILSSQQALYNTVQLFHHLPAYPNNWRCFHIYCLLGDPEQTWVNNHHWEHHARMLWEFFAKYSLSFNKVVLSPESAWPRLDWLSWTVCCTCLPGIFIFWKCDPAFLFPEKGNQDILQLIIKTHKIKSQSYNILNLTRIKTICKIHTIR